jgi:hypothetical protein
MPLPEIFVPIHEGNVTSEDLEDQPESRHADSSASPEQFQVEQPWRDQLLSKLSPTPTNHPYQSLAGNFPPIVVSGEPVLPVRAELPQASAESPGKIEPNKTQEIEPIPQDQIPRPPDNLLAASVAERWIPPALLAAWRRGDRHHKLVLASIGAACLGIFALILTLAVAHIDSPMDRSARSGPVQQSTAPPAVSSVSVGPPQTGPIQSPSSPPAAVPRRSHRPQKSLLANLADNVFGRKPEVIIEIDEDQVGVQVWTSKTSGFYYCADSPFYNAVQPGTLMTQRDALQSGYQPRLGQFCN